MSAVWAKLETHVVNGAFPLQRCVGSTDHSGVFLTQSTKHAPSAVALKLIPFDPESAEAQLSRWRAAAGLSHPHLLRIFEVGECRVAGLHCLYARMEFADQTLAQLLERRALTEDEAREMLAPTLDALQYLHQRNLVQGALKPSNFLVVGNQLKLASDTVRALGERGADSSTVADVRALGVTLCEALTRLRPSGLDGAGDVELPLALPASFRGIVSRCLSREPRDRPTVAELQAWLRGDPATAESPAPARAPATRLVIRVALPSGGAPNVAAVPQRTSWRVVPLALVAFVLVALGWAGYRMFSADSPVPHEAPRVEAPPPAAPGAAALSADVEPPSAKPAASGNIPVSQVMPVVSQSSLDTIRGTLRVSVRLIVSRSGAVIAATADDPGPSRYFERRSLEASRKWTFAPSDAEAQRSMRVRFAFTRSGATASVEPLP
jgi:hypothetical protein